MKSFTPYAACLVALTLFAAGCGRTDRLSGTQAGNSSGRAPVTGVATAPTGIPSQTVTLIAGRSLEIGAVHVWLEGDILKVQYEPESPWVLNATHLAVAASVADIPVNRAGNPQPGQFPYSKIHSPAVPEYTYAIDLAAAGLEDALTLELAAQADVSRLSPSGVVIASEGAWGEGELFDARVNPGKGGVNGKGGNWSMHFTVDMNVLRGLVLWNKLGSQYEVEHSVVGPNGVINGSVSYYTAQYGKGFKPDPRTGDHNTPANFIDFAGLNLGPRGTLEFWYWPDWNDWQVGHIVEISMYGNPDSPQHTYFLDIGYNDWQGTVNTFAGRVGGDGVEMDFVPGTAPGWITTAPFHMALTWDGSEPANANKMKFYINGSRISGLRFYQFGTPTFTDWDPAAVLRLGSRLYSGDWNRHNWEGDGGIIDNVKIWNYPKTDFSDRFNE